MNIEEFEATLRRFIRQEPFQPFEVELLDGRRIEVRHPGVALGGGGAAYLAGDEFIEFACRDVRAIHQVEPETAS